MGCYKSKRIECIEYCWHETMTNKNTHKYIERKRKEKRREKIYIPINRKIVFFYLRCASEEEFTWKKIYAWSSHFYLMCVSVFFSSFLTCSDTWLCLSRYFIERAIEQKIVLWFLALIVTWIFSRSTTYAQPELWIVTTATAAQRQLHAHTIL